MSAWWPLVQEFPTSLLLALGGVLLGVALWLLARRSWQSVTGRRRDRRRPSPEAFTHGFDLLLDSHWQEATEVLRQAVQHDPNRTREYFALGKLLRRRGEPGRSARMLEQLLARPHVDQAMRLQAQYELALAYRSLGWRAEAVAKLEQLLAVEPRQGDARHTLRRLYEDLGRWEAAAALEVLRLKRGEAQDRRTLAALLTQQGKAAWSAGQLWQSAAHLRAALALNPQGGEAALYLGRLLLQQGKLQPAFRVWDDLAKARPELLFLAFSDMQTAFRQLNNAAGWERFLRAFTERHPEDPMGYLALAEWHDAEQQSAEALSCLQRALALDPRCQAVHRALLSYYRGQHLANEMLTAYEQLLGAATLPVSGQFRCQSCAHVEAEPFWKCPVCEAWATVERLLPSSRVGLLPARNWHPASQQTGARAALEATEETAPASQPEEAMGALHDR